MRDKKLTVMSHLVWYILCFGILFFIVETVYALPVRGNGREFLIRTGTALLASAVFGIAIELFVRLGLRTVIGKMHKPYKEIVRELQEEGMSEKLKCDIEEQYRASSKKECYASYYNEYAILLSSYYSDIREHNKALEYIDSFNLDNVNENIAFVSYQHLLLRYYMVKLVVECEAGECERADETALEVEKAAALYADKTGLHDFAELAQSAYDILCGRTQKAIQRLNNKGIPEYNRISMLAKCHAQLEQFDEANILLEELAKAAKTEWERREVRLLRKELQSPLHFDGG